MYLHAISVEKLCRKRKGKKSGQPDDQKKRRDREGLLEYILESGFLSLRPEIAAGRIGKRKRGGDGEEGGEPLRRLAERKTRDRGVYRKRMHSTLAWRSLAKAALRNSRRTSGECENPRAVCNVLR